MELKGNCYDLLIILIINCLGVDLPFPLSAKQPRGRLRFPKPAVSAEWEICRQRKYFIRWWRLYFSTPGFNG
jgi:hypothetical protein